MSKKRKKIEKEIKKSYKKNPKRFTFLLITFLIIVGIGLFFGYKYGLFDFLNKPEVSYVFEQDSEGFYYYTEDGMSMGEYYYGINTLTDTALRDQLSLIIKKDFNKVSYGDARYILAISDRDPKNDNNVIGIYDNDVIANYWIGKGEGAWQREHVWPNSKLGIDRVDNNSKSQGSDLHNLRAITGINQTRSNRYFEESIGNAKTIGKEAFYPGDDHKGDVARILFYMEIMYDVLTLTNDVSKLENNSKTNYTLEGAFSGKLDLLIKWHKEDPVDEFEQKRNEFIFSGIAKRPDGKDIQPQGNRNPFIDKPELVHLIWEDKTIDDITKPIEDVEEVSINYLFSLRVDVYYKEEDYIF